MARVSNGNTNYSALNGILYDYSQTTLVAYPLGNTNPSYTISPSSVTTIAPTAFSGSVFTNINYLTSVTITPNVTNIGDSAFQFSGNLSTVTFLENNATPALGSIVFDRIATPSNAYYMKNADISSIQGIFTNYYQINLPCFKEGTKILTSQGYVKIENLQKGHRVQTLKNGFVPIDIIGKCPIYNSGDQERIKDRLYVCSREQYPELFEELILTGCHSILVDKLTEKNRENVINLIKCICVTDDKYRLPACLDERASTYKEEGTFTIYHIALENDNYFSNYGIYANGLLVESCSKRYLKELSNMELIG